MKRVLVTGATSMIGIAFINECLKNNIEVYAVVRPDSPHIYRLPQKYECLHILKYKLDEIEKIADLNIKMDTIFHFAWITGKSARNNAVLQERNIYYTAKIVELAKKLGCTKFVGAGSQAEYGWKNEKIQTNTPTTPDTAYGICKLAAGKLAQFMCEQYELAFIWVRVFSIYGVYDKEDTMIQYALKKFIKGEKACFSSATQKWDYLYSGDAGRAFYLLGENENASGVYNLAYGTSRKLKEYILEIKEYLNSTSEVEFDVNRNGKGIECDISKIRRDVGFEPRVSFAEGIHNIFRWEKEHGTAED